jgi:hypothetical protein
MNTAVANQNVLEWSDEEARQFGITPQVNRHSIHQLPWFSDRGLRELIENHPRSKMRVFTSGTDPERRHEDWQPIDTEGASADDILKAVRVGHLWVNLQRIDTVDDRFAKLGSALYAEIAKRCSHFKPVWVNHAFLFISSPNAMVYLHADYQPNMLWHIRGSKRIWIYPAYDERIATRRRIEEICAGGEDDLVFKPEFDRIGTAFSIGPGDTVSWPARSPHRVVNGNDLNVSLSTFHETSDDYQLVTDHCADYFFRSVFPPAADLNGPVRPVKRWIFKACRRAGLVKGRPVKEFYARFRIDPNAPHGISPIAGGPVLTEHSRLARAAANGGA